MTNPWDKSEFREIIKTIVDTARNMCKVFAAVRKSTLDFFCKY